MIAANRHDMHAIRIYDKVDAQLPDIGLIQMHDAETGNNMWVDTSIERVRRRYAEVWQAQTEGLNSLWLKTGTKNVAIRTDEDYVKKLMKLFDR